MCLSTGRAIRMHMNVRHLGAVIVGERQERDNLWLGLFDDPELLGVEALILVERLRERDACGRFD